MAGFNSATALEPWRTSRRRRLHSGENISLQFGHGVGAVKNSASLYTPNSLAIAKLQFGHGVGAVENHGTEGNAVLAIGLQFGHGVGAVENDGIQLTKLLVDLASIRPRRWSRGEPPHDELVATETPRFNSATALEPWRTSNKSCSGSLWKSFNSATALEPWRTWSGGATWAGVAMLQFGHGVGAVENLAAYAPIASLRASFNSATALEPWRTPLRRLRGDLQEELQFGHGVGAVENNLVTLPQTHPVIRLQFGHGVGAVENHRYDHGTLRYVPGFNSATALEPWRTSQRPLHFQRTLRFNSATALEPWRTAVIY